MARPFLLESFRSIHIFPHAPGRHFLPILFLRLFRNHRFRRQHQTGQRSGTLKGEPHHLSGIDHADLQAVFECFRPGVESKIIISFECLIEHNGTLATGIYGNLHQQLGQRPLEDINAPFFFPFGIDLIQNADTADQNNTAAGNNPLFHSRSSGIQASSTRATRIRSFNGLIFMCRPPFSINMLLNVWYYKNKVPAYRRGKVA